MYQPGVNVLQILNAGFCVVKFNSFAAGGRLVFSSPYCRRINMRTIAGIYTLFASLISLPNKLYYGY